MTTPNRSRARRALGIAVASVVAATPSLGCTSAHTAPETDASSPVDASIPVDAMPADAMAQADTGPAELDAGIPRDAQPAIDAWIAEDADALDAYYYPDGIRG